MADQGAQPQPGQVDPAATAQSGDGQGMDPYKLHDHAVRASKELEALATGLAHANAPQSTTKAFTAMADACRKLSTSLSRAPAPPPKGGAQNRTGESLDGAAQSYAASAQR